jgi:two-component system KDP operon response regulator KdpE
MAHGTPYEPRPVGPPVGDGTGNPRYAASPLVLLVEDDHGMRKFLRSTLSDQAFRVVETETGSEALTQAAAHNPDLVVLDFGLPDLDAIQVTTRLREWSGAPILVLSARDEERGKIAVLDAGANDYVTKPVRTGELLARIRVWLRQAQGARSQSPRGVLEVGDLRLDLDERRAYVCGRPVKLTPTQYKLFATLMNNAGKILTHEQILTAVWGPSYAKETQYLRVYMGQLRRKFESDPARPRYFLTEPGVGYRLSADSLS